VQPSGGAKLSPASGIASSVSAAALQPSSTDSHFGGGGGGGGAGSAVGAAAGGGGGGPGAPCWQGSPRAQATSDGTGESERVPGIGTPRRMGQPGAFRNKTSAHPAAKFGSVSAIPTSGVRRNMAAGRSSADVAG